MKRRECIISEPVDVVAQPDKRLASYGTKIARRYPYEQRERVESKNRG